MSRVHDPRWTPEEYRQKPREYDPEVAELIIERLANGEMLPNICADRDFPLPATFLRWVDLDPELEKQYTRARRTAAELSIDYMVLASEHRDPSSAGIRSRAFLEFAQKTDPARYGPRATLRVKEGEEDGGIDYREEVRRRIENISAKVGPKPTDPASESGAGEG